jgi:hypothetical protein
VAAIFLAMQQGEVPFAPEAYFSPAMFSLLGGSVVRNLADSGSPVLSGPSQISISKFIATNLPFDYIIWE